MLTMLPQAVEKNLRNPVRKSKKLHLNRQKIPYLQEESPAITRKEGTLLKTRNKRMVARTETVPRYHFLLLRKRALLKTIRRIRTNDQDTEKFPNTCRNSTKIKRNYKSRGIKIRSRPSALLAQEKCLKMSKRK
jgi:hypothetical protein